MTIPHLIQDKYKPTYKAMGWLIVQELIFALCALVDITCASFISDDAVIAVTVATTVGNFAIGLRNVYSSALRVTSARYFGANDKDAAGGVLTSITILSVAITVIIAFVLYIFGIDLLSLFTLTPYQLDLAYDYIKTRVPGYLIFSITNPMVRNIEAKGEVSRITRMRLVNLLNIPFSLILLQFWGVAGIGLASSLTEAVELPVVYFVFRPYYSKPQKKGFKDTVVLGLTYLPESLFDSSLNALSANLCIKYLSVASAVTVQLVKEFYDTFIDLVYASTRHVDIALGQAYGTGDTAQTVETFSHFKHCYFRIWAAHAVIALLMGVVYFNFIVDVASPLLAMTLLAASILAEICWSIAEPLSRVCGVYNIIKPVVATRVICLILFQIPSQLLALKLGADVFCIPICYIAADLLWCIVTYKLSRRLPVWGKRCDIVCMAQTSSV